MNSYLEGWEVILIVINGVVHCKNMSKRSATNWSAILHSVTFSAHQSLMWIALQSSTPKYPGILECSTQGVALRNALCMMQLGIIFGEQHELLQSIGSRGNASSNWKFMFFES